MAMNIGMEMESPIGLVTTLFGWHYHNSFTDLLAVTGTWLVPFIAMIIQNWYEPTRSQLEQASWITSVKRMEWDFYPKLFVIMIAVTPIFAVSSSNIRYTDDRGITQTGADTKLLGETPNQVLTPLIWQLVMDVSNGVNAVVRGVLPAPQNFRHLTAQLSHMRVQDPVLRAEVSQFYGQCYLPSLARFQRIETSGSEVEVDWIGSPHFVATEGYYKKCSRPAICESGFHTREELPGWPYRWYDDGNQETRDWGKPDCSEWWTATDQGLRDRLVVEAKKQMEASREARGPTDVIANVSDWINTINLRMPGSYRDGEEFKDVLVRRMLTNAPPKVSETNEDEGLLGSGVGMVMDTVSGAGAVAAIAVTKVVMTVVVEALPILQAFLLFFLIFSLPFGLLFSGYSIEAVIAYAFIFFTVSMWTAFWAIAGWIDDHIFTILYPEDTLISIAGTGVLDDLVMSLIALTLYVGFPAWWSWVMVSVGVKSAGKLNTLMDEGRGAADSAGKRGANLAKK